MVIMPVKMIKNKQGGNSKIIVFPKEIKIPGMFGDLSSQWHTYLFLFNLSDLHLDSGDGTAELDVQSLFVE